MNVFEKLAAVQARLKAPKSQSNDFGHYKYRSCEDILEAVKPLQAEIKAITLLSDEVVQIGERYYVKVTATFIDCEKSEDKITVTASAREEEVKKGMDGSQITGASSSYARKYALNGLFDIDDTEDSDKTNCGETKKTEKPLKQAEPENKPFPEQNAPPADQIAILKKKRGAEIRDLIAIYKVDDKTVAEEIKKYGDNVSELTEEQYISVLQKIKENKL